MTLSGQTLLVTGATSGVGHALARRLAARGAHVVVHGRDERRLADVAREVGGTPVVADLAAPDGARRLADATLQARPDLCGVLHNAAVQQNYLFAERPPADSAHALAQEIGVDLVAPLQTTALLLPALRDAAARTGRPSLVVFVTSGLALAPKKSAAGYCAAKAGLRTFAKALRYQLDDEVRAGGPRVRVVDAMLPLVDTPMTAGRATRLAKIPPEQAAAEIVAGLEGGRDEIHVAKAALFARLHRWAPRAAERLLRDG